MISGWFGVRSGPRTRFPQDTVRCGPRLGLGLSNRIQPTDCRKNDQVNDGEAVLAGPAPGLDQNAFVQEFVDRALDRRFAQIGMTLDGPFRAPELIPSSLALSARNIMICLRTGLPNLRCAQRFATFQLIAQPPSRLRDGVRSRILF